MKACRVLEKTIILGIAMTAVTCFADYYIDAEKGKDSNKGTSQTRPWQTIANLNKAKLTPGTRILFRGGQKHKVNLEIPAAWSGTKAKPITITSYGKGKAILDGGKGTALSLADNKWLVVENLTFVGCGRKDGNDGHGIKFYKTTDLVIRNVEVSGFRLAGIWGMGDANTRITHVYAHDNGAAGIEICGWKKDITKNLYIGYCVAENNPGDPKNFKNHSGNGIVVGGLKKALVEYCRAFKNGWDMPRKGNGPVGIWGWNSDELVIQHCISYDNLSPGTDGGGFDLDGGCTNSILQYNLSYNNAGAGYLLCQYKKAPVWKNNIVRYNISYEDGKKNMNSGIAVWAGDKGMSDALVHDNIIVNSKYAVASHHDVPGIVYRNNIFVSGKLGITGPFRNSRFDGNLYWHNGGKLEFKDCKKLYKSLKEWADATKQETRNGRLVGIIADPKLKLPKSPEDLPTDPSELEQMRYFRAGRSQESVFECNQKKPLTLR